MLSLYFDYSFIILVISRFGFKGGIWVLIAPVPGHCMLVTSIGVLPLRMFLPISATPISSTPIASNPIMSTRDIYSHFNYMSLRLLVFSS